MSSIFNISSLPAVDVKIACNNYISFLMQIGYGSMMKVPTYQALDLYKKELLYEDLFYRWFHRDRLLLFKEAGSRDAYIPPKIKENIHFFIQSLTTGVFTKDEFNRIVDASLIDQLNEVGMIKEDENNISLTFRVIPVPDGAILSDVFSQTADEYVHMGLDSITFWNFLLSNKKTVSRAMNVLDLGCGSGIHSYLIKKLNGNSRILCSDISARCLEYTRENLSMNKVDSNVQYNQGSWFDEIEKQREDNYELILCNPPFEWRLDDEKEYQTTSAYGGRTYGMDNTLFLLNEMPRFLTESGKGYIFSQTIIADDKRNLLYNEIRNLQLRHKVVVHILFEHLLTSEVQMKHMLENSLSHYANVVVEIDRGARSRGVEVKEYRPWLKCISDRKRVAVCRQQWKDHFKTKEDQPLE